MSPGTSRAEERTDYLAIDRIHHGDARVLLPHVRPGSVACSFWSPPYFTGKAYERYLSYEGWVDLIETIIGMHARLLLPGGFVVVNIADILCFPDASMPRIQAVNISGRRSAVSREVVLQARAEHPQLNRYQLAEMLGCSEQTVDRRLNGNNIRGGKYAVQTRVHLVGGMIERAAAAAGLYLYDRRIWAKDPSWENSRWHTLSYRSVDEFEYLYIFWNPGITTVDRRKLAPEEWAEWGSRGIWRIPSVRANDDHEAKFPIELARRVIRLFSAPGDTVLDCFVGSGTTAVAAIEEGRHYIGIDLHEPYCVLASEECRKAARGGKALTRRPGMKQ